MRVTGTLRETPKSMNLPPPMLPPAPRTTITEIARHLGLHHSTVSRALRNDPAISAETRGKVGQAAAELGYQPDPRLREMMAQVRSGNSRSRHESLAVLVPTDKPRRAAAIAAEALVAGIKQTAKASGFGLDLHSLDEGDPTGGRLSRVLSSRNTRGVIVLPTDRSGHLFDVASQDRSLVVVGADAHPHLAEHRVCFDAFRGMCCLLERLHGEGCREFILHLSGSPFRCTESAYLAAAGTFGRSHRDASLSRGSPDEFVPGEEKDGRVLVTDCPITAAKLFTSLPRKSLAMIGPATQGPRGWHVDFGRIGATAVSVLVRMLDHHQYGSPEHPHTTLIGGEWKS